jgi:hypothetical protein
MIDRHVKFKCGKIMKKYMKDIGGGYFGIQGNDIGWNHFGKMY